MRRIGIMGGTFNPIHIGHLTVAEWALDALALNEVWFIPTGISYMKSKESSDEAVLPGRERLFMANLAVMGNEAFRCLDIEVEREGYTYSYETMESLKGMYPEDVFFFIAGADCLFTIEKWKYPERLFHCCTLAVFMRSGFTLREMEEKKACLEQRFGAAVILLPFVNLSVSSTDIRGRIQKGQSVRYLVPDNVLAYIKDRRFYCEKGRTIEQE